MSTSLHCVVGLYRYTPQLAAKVGRRSSRTHCQCNASSANVPVNVGLIEITDEWAKLGNEKGRALAGTKCVLLLLSCPSHTFSHLRAHAIARSVTVARSSAVQSSSSRRQERRWAIVCGSPQSQSTDWASSRYTHLLITVFARPTPVRSRLRARQQSQCSPDPAVKDSAISSPIFTEAGTSVRLSFQSCSLLLLADESSGVTVRMKLFRDFNLLAAGW